MNTSAPIPALHMPTDDMARVVCALRTAGLDRWSAAAHQPAGQLLMTVERAATRGDIWLRPHFTPRFAQVALPIEEAIAALYVASRARLATGADPDAPATEDEALAAWERLLNAAEGVWS
jgi:hypothetical protein